MAHRRHDPRDAEIAKRLRVLRLERGLSQSELGSALGVTFQQIQKYERGANRISAGKLYRLAETFNVPVTYFFSDDEGLRSQTNSQTITTGFEFLQTDGAIRLIRAYSRIGKSGVRLKLLKLAESLAGE